MRDPAIGGVFGAVPTALGVVAVAAAANPVTPIPPLLCLEYHA